MDMRIYGKIYIIYRDNIFYSSEYIFFTENMNWPTQPDNPLTIRVASVIAFSVCLSVLCLSVLCVLLLFF